MLFYKLDGINKYSKTFIYFLLISLSLSLSLSLSDGFSGGNAWLILWAVGGSLGIVDGGSI